MEDNRSMGRDDSLLSLSRGALIHAMNAINSSTVRSLLVTIKQKEITSLRLRDQDMMYVIRNGSYWMGWF